MPGSRCRGEPLARPYEVWRQQAARPRRSAYMKSIVMLKIVLPEAM